MNRKLSPHPQDFSPESPLNGPQSKSEVTLHHSQGTPVDIRHNDSTTSLNVPSFSKESPDESAVIGKSNSTTFSLMNHSLQSNKALPQSIYFDGSYYMLPFSVCSINRDPEPSFSSTMSNSDSSVFVPIPNRPSLWELPGDSSDYDCQGLEDFLEPELMSSQSDYLSTAFSPLSQMSDPYMCTMSSLSTLSITIDFMDLDSAPKETQHSEERILLTPSSSHSLSASIQSLETDVDVHCFDCQTSLSFFEGSSHLDAPDVCATGPSYAFLTPHSAFSVGSPLGIWMDVETPSSSPIFTRSPTPHSLSRIWSPFQSPRGSPPAVDHSITNKREIRLTRRHSDSALMKDHPKTSSPPMLTRTMSNQECRWAVPFSLASPTPLPHTPAGWFWDPDFDHDDSDWSDFEDDWMDSSITPRGINTNKFTTELASTNTPNQASSMITQSPPISSHQEGSDRNENVLGTMTENEHLTRRTGPISQVIQDQPTSRSVPVLGDVIEGEDE
ncbi:hypothetical protein BLNAU_3641 [Blattamonas nauphoetae]|uniref:Uncharacterized protein n=1 Tax=Blattamonas nauphoetae TaxID=2049346 RepID=A0ABQ9YD45_9EUKA|nr:hypothetical protein BLNAU_3641 [Blattamonas nauphoetae]